MASCSSQSAITIPFFTGKAYWKKWFECIKLLATLSGTWKFLNPDLPDTEVYRLGMTISQEVSSGGGGGGDKVKAIPSLDKEYGPALQELGKLAAAIHNSINSEIRVQVLKEANKDGLYLVDGIHIARRMLVCLVGKYEPGVLGRAAARQEQAAQEPVPASRDRPE
jgi:hypothetical protein